MRDRSARLPQSSPAIRRADYRPPAWLVPEIALEFELDPQSYEMVIERVRRTSPFVVLDLPHVWTSWVKHTLLAADDAIIVAGPDLASLRNTKNIMDLLKAMRPYDSPPTVVLSMVGVPKRPEIPFKDFAEALGAEPVASIE